MQGDFRQVKARLVGVIKQMMAARPEKRFQEAPPRPALRDDSRARTAPRTGKPAPGRTPEAVAPEKFAPAVICFGGSTGATVVLVDILSQLAADYPVPIIVVQHIAAGFVEGMARWLDSSLKLDVTIAREGDRLRPGRVLVAPDDVHLAVAPGGVIETSRRSSDDRHVPSIDHLFKSVADVYKSRAMGIILSGMGRDGCLGLSRMRQKGAITIAQSEETSIIFGMPAVALKEQAARHEMAPSEIAGLLLRFSR
jgi:two-component system chemotaxis response regulator CheB